ncbi:hypothetical protein K1T35_06660 [Pseudonocardia sp. DSM 110487]|uniref:hypothetical protein n=1 Tax=Pseudonocardia sp. DSM 110487 TaxID=2865833 RepID=UPI001C6A46C4|nr:hypothetical protein [Pseudonocardia sp. DSM 110487]QYN36942.1 hypothetical protein K1T35_06660 [Pseudonocardia sp. DSM 110487]
MSGVGRWNLGIGVGLLVVAVLCSGLGLGLIPFALLRAFAAEPRLEPRWATPPEYRNEDGSIVPSAGDVGFSAVPTIREVREHHRKDSLSDAT